MCVCMHLGATYGSLWLKVPQLKYEYLMPDTHVCVCVCNCGIHAYKHCPFAHSCIAFYITYKYFLLIMPICILEVLFIDV